MPSWQKSCRGRAWFPSATEAMFAQSLVPTSCKSHPHRSPARLPQQGMAAEGTGHANQAPQQRHGETFSAETQARSGAEMGCPGPCPCQNCSAILCQVLRLPRDHAGQSREGGTSGEVGWEQKLTLSTLTHHRDAIHLNVPREKWGASQSVGCLSLWSQSFTLAIIKCKRDAQPCCICHDKVKVIAPFVVFYRNSVLWPSSLPFSWKPPSGLCQMVVTKVTLWKRYCMFHFGKTLYL